jgi:hypothetical protein
MYQMLVSYVDLFFVLNKLARGSRRFQHYDFFNIGTTIVRFHLMAYVNYNHSKISIIVYTKNNLIQNYAHYFIFLIVISRLK